MEVVSTSNSSPSSAPSTPAKKAVDLHARSLNLLLEQIFLLSLRRDAAPPLKNIDSRDDTLLNSRNLNDVVIMHLMSGEEPNGAVAYLVNCWRRSIQKESSVTEKIREEFVRYASHTCWTFTQQY
jgi:hypothetical protein